MQKVLVPNHQVITDSALALKKGFLVAFPTETVYGLGADAENKDSVERLFNIKKRPKNHPVIVHIGDLEYLDFWTIEIPKFARDLAEAVWPGPLTLILQRSNRAKDFLTGGQNSVAVRFPSNLISQKLLTEFHKLGGKGVAAPSANKFGSISPTNVAAVKQEIGKDLHLKTDYILDGGQCKIGIESTIVSCLGSQPEILRAGLIDTKIIEFFIGPTDQSKNDQIKVHFPGELKKHYAPKAAVITEGAPREGDGFLALINFETPAGCVRLAEPKNIFEYAQVLYKSFRNADDLGLQRIYVIKPSQNGIGIAINDRIQKASS